MKEKDKTDMFTQILKSNTEKELNLYPKTKLAFSKVNKIE